MLAINFTPPTQILSQLGNRAKLARLHANLSRQTLAERSGVPASSIKRFETTGLISSSSLVAILFALDRLDELAHLFAPLATAPSIRELDLEKRQRQRGRQ
jgi:transcriptional regulator with XRE-family HTH domain